MCNNPLQTYENSYFFSIFLVIQMMMVLGRLNHIHRQMKMLGIKRREWYEICVVVCRERFQKIMIYCRCGIEHQFISGGLLFFLGSFLVLVRRRMQPFSSTSFSFHVNFYVNFQSFRQKMKYCMEDAFFFLFFVGLRFMFITEDQ